MYVRQSISKPATNDDGLKYAPVNAAHLCLDRRAWIDRSTAYDMDLADPRRAGRTCTRGQHVGVHVRKDPVCAPRKDLEGRRPGHARACGSGCTRTPNSDQVLAAGPARPGRALPCCSMLQPTIDRRLVSRNPIYLSEENFQSIFRCIRFVRRLRVVRFKLGSTANK